MGGPRHEEECEMGKQGKAVICREWNKPVVVEEIEVESPRRGEVMIEITACGVCHSDSGGRHPPVRHRHRPRRRRSAPARRVHP